MYCKNQLSLPFDELFAWRNFIKVVENIKLGESLVFYDFNKKLKFTKLWGQRLRIVTMSLDGTENTNLADQTKFERVFMKSVLKSNDIHIHSYEKSPSRNKDWRKQVYKCTDPDCRHYAPAASILGKRASCGTCGKLMVIEKSQIKNVRIVGLCCEQSKKGEAFRQAQQVITELEIFNPLVADESVTVEENPLLDFLMEEHG